MTHFSGSTFSPALDEHRLSKQLDRVRDLMCDGEWRTLADIEAATGSPQASVSARLRDLRKPRFGGLTVERRRVAQAGLWEYRIKAKEVQEVLAL